MAAHRLFHLAGMLAALVLLLLSGLLTAVVLRAPEHHWLAWISLLPLSVAVRWLHSATAALAGALWGASLYLFSTAGPTPAVETMAPALGPSALLLGLLTVIPAVYVGLAARPARAIGFKLLTLALGWTLLEAVLHLYGVASPKDGLLTGSHGEGPRLHWFARLLCYVFTAFLAAFANTSLVTILSGARFRLPTERVLGAAPNAVGGLPSQVIPAIQPWCFRRGYPRAPPAPGPATFHDPVGMAHSRRPKRAVRAGRT